MSQILKNAVVGNIPFYILSGVAVLMLVISWVMPPAWKIDSSVIAAVGEIFAFSGLWSVVKALDKGVDAEISHKDTRIKIENE